MWNVCFVRCLEAFKDLLPNRNPMQVRLRLHARCMPLLQILDLAAKSDMLADSCQLMGIPATSLIHCR